MNQNLLNLIDAICDNFMEATNGRAWAPSTVKNDDGTITQITHCNQFVNGVARSLNYFDFWPSNQKEPMEADDIYNFVSKSNLWTKITWDVAQDHANNGAFVIAAQLGNPHGHVNIIRPGVAQPSGHFGHNAPRCANVGASVFIDQDVAWAFQTNPDYFVLNETINA